MIPYSEIAETADRRWTVRLMEQLVAPDLPAGELDDLVGALQAVSDPRSVGPLEAILVDPARPAPVREAAGSVLSGMEYLTVDVPEERLRQWWREGDPILRRHALACMDAVDCPDIVLRIAADPAHESHADAIGWMMFFFDLPEHEQLKINALSHPDPKVRSAAACVLLWDEPVASELPLMQATRDPVPEVVAEAANTLKYYPSLQVIRRLHELLEHADAKVREEATESCQSIRHELLVSLCRRDCRAADHVGRWLRPVWDLLAFRDEELRPDAEEAPLARRQEPGEVMPVADLLALLADPDTSPRLLGDRLWSLHWQAYEEGERRRLRPVLLAHPDPLVRDRAARAFAVWQDADALRELFRDIDFDVRKMATYHLGQLPPTPGVADLAWEHLQRHDTLGTHATETLATFVRHADRAVAVQRLGWIAGDHGRHETLRVAAVDHLADLGATEEVRQLGGLLLEPPAVTWALHIGLLDAIMDLGLPSPALGHLREIDNLHVQAAVARIKV